MIFIYFYINIDYSNTRHFNSQDNTCYNKQSSINAVLKTNTFLPSLKSLYCLISYILPRYCSYTP